MRSRLDAGAGAEGSGAGAHLAVVTSVSAAALFLLGVNTTGINTALHAIAADLGVGTAALGWAVGVYMPAVAALVVLGGRLGDMLGQRVTVVGGSLVFAVGAVVVAASGSEAVLIAGRVLQGVGAAALMPSTMAMLRLSRPRSDRSSRCSRSRRGVRRRPPRCSASWSRRWRRPCSYGWSCGGPPRCCTCTCTCCGDRRWWRPASGQPSTPCSSSGSCTSSTSTRCPRTPWATPR
uniref:MFS transporter n=1 Tax=Streptomyces sp. NBC_00049 TaxID=2903617 RepID=A0AAU2JIC2_9ACTN